MMCLGGWGGSLKRLYHLMNTVESVALTLKKKTTKFPILFHFPSRDRRSKRLTARHRDTEESGVVLGWECSSTSKWDFILKNKTKS